MQSKYLCAPLLLVSALAAQAAPAPLPSLSSQERLTADAAPKHQAPFSALTIARVRLGSRTQRLESSSKPAPDTLLGIHGPPDAVLTLVKDGLALRGFQAGRDASPRSTVKDGFVLRDVKTGRETFLGADWHGKLPDWAASVAIQPDPHHVAWLYNRASHAMCFAVDGLGFVDAISVASTGPKSPKTPTLEAQGITGSLSLGDDLRQVMSRFGYPDTIESHRADAAKSPKPDDPLRTFELRYQPRAHPNQEPIPGMVFTVRDNHVLRFYAYNVWQRPA